MRARSLRHSIGLRYLGLAFRVRSTERPTLRWLAEFLRPWFEEADRADIEIRFHADTEHYERIRASGPHPDGGSRVAFALDTHLVELPAWSSAQDGEVFFDPGYDVFYRLEQSPLRVTILAARPNRLHARIALMRVVREFVLRDLDRRDGLLVHGAALRLRGHGIVVAGPKRAGKTSFLIHALGRMGADFIANDRVVVHATDGSLRARGLPTVVTVREDGLSLFPVLKGRLSRSSDWDMLTLREARRGILGPTRPNAEGRYTVSPAQFGPLLGARPAADEPLDAVLFPRVTQKPGGIEFVRLAPGTARRALRAGVFRAGSSRKSGDLFDAPAGDRPLLSESDPLDRIAGTLPCFECRLGLDAYRDPDSLADLVSLIEPDGSTSPAT